MRDIDGRTYLDNFILYNVNMDNYTNKINELDTKELKDDIILIMLAQDRDILIKLAKKYKVVAKYMKEVDEVNKDPEFREYMSKEEDDMKIRNSLIKEGIEQSKIEIANNLLNTDMSISEISKIVNLPEEEIIKIKDAK
jgi:predicted transposase/invertase (TIGR01784 family)